jgi:ATP-dependent DNA helicase RecQ
LIPTPNLILEKYWGYKEFRPLQDEIIDSVLQGKDTLALLPTGGGKSICYQVPALMKEGICIVITPLIALMKDQVEGLVSKGIRALSIHSGQSAREVDRILDNAIYGNYKFLYLSPERLETDLFKERASRLPVSLIAVDEAHCISEWGYDFRPAYLKISEVRNYFPDVPVIALTASATADVSEDIRQKLAFKKGSNVFRKSFERENLIYGVINEEDKKKRILELVNKIKGTAIIYVRNRRTTKDIASFLQQNKISASYYHGGLEHQLRTKRQEDWISGKTRIIVSTNAFGMGIDKPDVRLVIHYDLPETLEAYYQEAGRAGRDLKRSFALALVNGNDKKELETRTERIFPQPDEVLNVYHALGNFFQLPFGNGKDQSFDFRLTDFCERYSIAPLRVYQALEVLEKAGYISLTESFFMPPRFIVTVDYHSLYAFEIANRKFEPLIKTLLRSYGGCFDEYVKINEADVAKRTGESIKNIISMLKELTRLEIIDYQQQKNAPQITYLQERLDKSHILIDKKYLSERKKIHKTKIDSVIHYAFTDGKCRSRMLLQYFGEEAETDCGHCDYCLKHKDPAQKEKRNIRIQEEIKNMLVTAPLEVSVILKNINAPDERETLEVIRLMVDNGTIKWIGDNSLQLAE